jgi:hypothetical protein
LSLVVVETMKSLRAAIIALMSCSHR